MTDGRIPSLTGPAVVVDFGLLFALDQVGAAFGMLTMSEGPNSVHPAADTIARFEVRHAGAIGFEIAGGRQPGKPGACHDHVGSGTVGAAHPCSMMAHMLSIASIVPLVAVLSQTQPAITLEPRVKALIAESGAEVAVAFRMLDGSRELLIDADKTFHAASTMKVPVMIELFWQASTGAIGLDDPLPIRNEFHSIVDGSVYSLSEGDDSDREVYAAVGKTMTLRRLCELLITASSNFAGNLLIEKLGVDNVRRTVSRLGAGMQVLRGVEDTKAFQKGMNNTTTARALLDLLESLAAGKAVNASADEQMIEILKRQTFRDAIPAGVPAGTPVAHKTGTITRIHHDAAIVYGPRPYILVLLVRGIDDKKQSAALMAALSRIVWEAAH